MGSVSKLCAEGKLRGADEKKPRSEKRSVGNKAPAPERFPVLSSWIKSTVKAEFQRRLVPLKDQLERIAIDLEPDVRLPDESEHTRFQSLVSTISAAIYRMLCKLVDELVAELPTLLNDPPSTHEGKCILFEQGLNAQNRDKANNELKALDEVKNELDKYGEPPTMAQPPDDLLCPISREVMKDPVLAADGHVFDREWIQRHIEKERGQGPVLSPMTNLPLEDLILRPCHPIRSRCKEWHEQHPDA